MYGKNAMGAYKDKISYEERWQVIHYIRSLQAKALKLAYNEFENTLNDVDRPAALEVSPENDVTTEGEANSDDLSMNMPSGN
jgi:hypothetical protein